jgi:DNA ligase (NAD+)
MGMNLDQYKLLPVPQLVATLELADEQYCNDGESFLADEAYDELRHHLETLMPTHPYLGRVGSPVRGEKIKLPAPMGGMIQIYEGEWLTWLEKHNLADEEASVDDKLDGTSVLLVYGRDGYLEAGYSRGEGTEASDITRHILKIPSVPKKVSGPMLVRAENIMPITNFETAQALVKKSDGNPYKTIRGLVAGVMNSERKPDEIYPLIDLVAYRIIDTKLSKRAQKERLAEEGFKVVHGVYTKMHKITESKLTKYLEERRSKSAYEIDGLVVSVVNPDKAADMNSQMREGNLQELSMIKFKVNNQFATSKVVAIEWNNSKHGLAKPTVVYEPVNLGGVTASRANGQNARYIIEQGLGPGAIIKLVRSGDVIPNIEEVVKKVEPQLPQPESDYTWIKNLDGENGADWVLKSAANDINVLARQMIDFFSSLGTPFLKDGNVVKLIDAGFDSIEKVINAQESDLVGVMGANGIKAFEGLHVKLTNVQLYELMGATTLFGRGFGERKFKKLQQALGVDGILGLTAHDVEIVRAVPGFNETARNVIENMPAFRDFMEAIQGKFILAQDNTLTSATEGLPLAGQKIVFTGFRDKGLEAKVIMLGGEMSDNVSKKTYLLVADDPESTTGKAKKARDVGVETVDIQTFIDRIERLMQAGTEADDEESFAASAISLT